MKCKKLLSLLMAGMLVCLLAGCGENENDVSSKEPSIEPVILPEIRLKSNNMIENMALEADETDQKVSLTVWCDKDEVDFMKGLVREFEEMYLSADFEFDIDVKYEKSGKFAESPKDSADVLLFPSGKIEAYSNALIPVIDQYKELAVEENTSQTISCGMFNGQMYGFPKCPDLQNLIFYDKRVLSEDDVQSLETIIEKSAQQGKNMLFNLENAFYCADMFLTADVEMSCSEGKMSANFTSDKALNAAKAICELVKHNEKGILAYYPNGGESVYSSPFGRGDISAQIATVSQYYEIYQSLGAENFGVAKLPTVKIDGKDVPMKCFDGYTLFGVNAYTKCPVSAMALACYLSKSSSKYREYTVLGILPTDLTIDDLDLLNDDYVYQSFKQQLEYAEVYQEKINSQYYAAGIPDFISKIEEHKGEFSDSELNEMLAEIQSKFKSGE